MPRMRLVVRLAVGLSLLAVAPVAAQITIRLNRTFVEKYKDRVTLDAPSYTVDRAHPAPNPPSKDGDMHVAGHSPTIKLATVAEIMNAASVPGAVTAIHDAQSSHHPIHLMGAWRIWAEHGGEDAQIQGATLAPITTTNPPHVFELHPLLTVGDQDLHGTLIPIEGYEPKEAEDAFSRYEGRTFKIKATATRVTMTTSGIGYNYVEYRFVPSGPVHTVEDGLFVIGDVLDLDGDLLVRGRRMAVPAGTPAYDRFSHSTTADTLHLLGIPRIDLALVSWRVRHRADRPEALTWNLPYEIIVVGLYEQ